MEKIYVIIGETNGYIANRDIRFNGKCKRIFRAFDNLKEANEELLSWLNEDYVTHFKNWGSAIGSGYGVGHTNKTKSYSYDSRSYYTEEITAIDGLSLWEHEDISWERYKAQLDL